MFQYFSRQISFSRTFQESPLNLSTFQVCANPDLKIIKPINPASFTFSLANFIPSFHDRFLLALSTLHIEII